LVEAKVSQFEIEHSLETGVDSSWTVYVLPEPWFIRSKEREEGIWFDLHAVAVVSFPLASIFLMHEHNNL